MIGYGDLRLDCINYIVGWTLHEKRNDPSIRDWCRQTGLIDEMQQEKWIKWQSKDPNTKMYLIKHECRDNWDSVGVCGLTSIDWVHRRAEFSCYIFPEHHRQGFAKEALILLFDHGFDDLNLNLIWGETFEGNHAYKLFVDKLGMTYDGRRRQFYYKNGKYIDALLISITKNEWKENRC